MFATLRGQRPRDVDVPTTSIRREIDSWRLAIRSALQRAIFTWAELNGDELRFAVKVSTQLWALCILRQSILARISQLLEKRRDTEGDLKWVGRALGAFTHYEL